MEQLVASLRKLSGLFFLNKLSLKSRDIFPKSPKITTPLSCSKQ